MLWLAAYAGTIFVAFVYLVSTPLALRLSPLELAAAAVAVGTVGGAWAGLGAALLTGSLSLGALGLTALALGGLAAGRRGAAARGWAALRARRPLVDGDDAVGLALVAALALPARALYASRMLPEGPGGALLSGGSCYGDLPIHMQIAESFLAGCNRDVALGRLRSPIFWPEPLTYPFLPDFHAAMLVRAGARVGPAFAATGTALALALAALLYALAVRLTRSRLGGVLAVGLTLFAGGLGGPRWVAARGWDEAARSDVVQHDYTGEWKHLWFAFVPHILLPQRGGTYAYPVAVLVLLLVWVATEPEARHAGGGPADRTAPLSRGARGAVLAHAGALAGMLPLVQAHAFIGVGIVVGVVALLDAHKWLADPGLLPGWAAAGALAAAAAAPQMAGFVHTATAGFYGKFISYGWLYLKDLYVDFAAPHGVWGFYRFWWHSLGPTLPLLTLALALLALEAAGGARLGRELRAALGPGGVDAFLKAARDVDAVRDGAGAGGGGGWGRAGGGGGGTPSATDSDSDERALPRHDAPRPPPPASGGAEGGAHHGGVRPARAGAADRARRAAADELALARADARLRPLATRLGAAIAAADAALAPPLAAFAAALGGGWLDSPDGLGLGPANTTPLHARRPLDALKFGLGGVAVFLVGNYVNFQPWDRDNAKLFYVFIFVASALNGALLAAPVEALVSAGPGFGRVTAWLRGGVPPVAPDVARALRGGGALGGSGGGGGGEAGAGAGAGAGGGGGDDAGAPGAGARGAAVTRRGAPGGGAAAAPSPLSAPPPAPVGGARLARLAAPAGPRARLARGGLALLGCLACPALVVLSTLSGYILLAAEFSLSAPLFDADARLVGQWFRDNTRPTDVVAHSNSHVQPPASLAGRPSLVAYFGWVSNHGYNANERLGDRDYLMSAARAPGAPDARCLDILRKYGIAYVLSEYGSVPRHGDSDEDVALGGALTRVHVRGRFEVWRVGNLAGGGRRLEDDDTGDGDGDGEAGGAGGPGPGGADDA